MTTTLVLCIPDPNLPFTVTTDASDFAVGAVLQQDQGQGPQPVAYTSRKMNPAEWNYPAHDKELLTIMHALAKWRVYLHGRPFTIYSDHATLTHLKNQPNLNAKQVRWLGKMQDFDFKIVHIPGKQNIVTDALSRQANSPQRDYCNPYLHPPKPGSKYPWISLHSSPKPRPDMMQLWSLWTPSPKWYTSLQPRPLPPLQKQPNSSLSTSSDYMAYP